ncbi:hypothetical protein Tco_0055538 [Tanacetum coccineum]
MFNKKSSDKFRDWGLMHGMIIHQGSRLATLLKVVMNETNALAFSGLESRPVIVIRIKKVVDRLETTLHSGFYSLQ